MTDLLSKLFPKIPHGQNQRFNNRKFSQNNLRILLISSVLVFEQGIYAGFVAESGSLLQQIYIISSLYLIFLVALSLYFYFNKSRNITLTHKVQEVSLAFFGLGIAIIRFAFIHDLMSLPTVYLATLYGLAVIFYFNYKQSFMIYSFSILFFFFMFGIREPGFLGSRLSADVISNSFIAWIVSVINYNRYVGDFINTIKIGENNEKLKQKNEKIEEINKKLQKLSTTDKLTNLSNRRKMEEILERVYQESKRYNKSFTIIIIDLDYFKKVNDNYGHQTGDKILQEVSALIENNVRAADSCGRWGGEEFLVACPNTNKKAGIKLAERLRKIIANASLNPVKELTASFGVSVFSGEEKIDQVIARADRKLYKAKENGRNRVEPEI